MEKAYVIWRAFQDKVLERIAAITMLGCTLLALLEVVRRYVFGVSYEWQQDAVTLFMLSAVFLYFSNAQRRGAHLTVTLLSSVLESMGPGALRINEYIQVLVSIISCVFMALVVWWGFVDVEDSFKYASRSESLSFPMWPFLVVLLVSFSFMSITMFFQVYRGVQHLRGRRVLDDPPDALSGEKLH